MTVAELKEKLSHVDDYLDVKIAVQTSNGAENAHVKWAQIESSPTTRRVFVITPEVP